MLNMWAHSLWSLSLFESFVVLAHESAVLEALMYPPRPLNALTRKTHVHKTPTHFHKHPWTRS